MKTSCIILACILAVGLAVGCASPTPQEQSLADRGKAQGIELLTTFAGAISDKSPAQIDAVLAPGLPKQRVTELKVRLERASWMERYSGYKLDARAALDALSWKDWLEPDVRVRLSATSAAGRPLLDEIVLVRVGEKWYISDFTLPKRTEQDPIDPPQRLRADLEPLIGAILTELASGDIGEIYYSLPNEDSAHYRTPKVGFWENLSGEGPGGAVSIYDTDLTNVKQFHVAAWPAPNEARFFEVSSGRIKAVFDVQYDWPDGGITEADTLHIELTFARTAEKWIFQRIALSAKGIPYST